MLEGKAELNPQDPGEGSVQIKGKAGILGLYKVSTVSREKQFGKRSIKGVTAHVHLIYGN